MAWKHDHHIKKWKNMEDSIFGCSFSTYSLDQCYFQVLVCPDLTAEISDMSFGDPWIPKIIETEKNWPVYCHMD